MVDADGISSDTRYKGWLCITRSSFVETSDMISLSGTRHVPGGISIFFDRLVETIHLVFFTRLGRTLSANLWLFVRFCLTGNSDSLVSDGRCRHGHRTARISHTQNIFSRVAQGQARIVLVAFRKTVIPRVTDHVSIAAIFA